MRTLCHDFGNSALGERGGTWAILRTNFKVRFSRIRHKISGIFPFKARYFCISCASLRDGGCME
jgi:hypothetical protein